MKNWSLQTKIISGFILVGIGVLILGIIGLTTNIRLSGHINTIGENALPSIYSLWKVNEAQSAADAAFFTQLAPGINPNKKREELKQLEDSLKKIDEGFEEYSKIEQNPEQENFYKNNIVPAWDKWKSIMKNLIQMNQEFSQYNLSSPKQTQIDLLLQGKRNTPEFERALAAAAALEKIYDYAFDVEESAYLEATNQLVKFLESTQKLGNDARRDAQKDIGNTTFWTLAAMAIGLGSAIAFGFVVAGSMKTLNKVINEVQRSGIQITTSTTQIAASGKQLEATVAEQLASTKEVTATSQQIATTARRLAKTMEQVMGLARETAQSASSGQKDLSQMENLMLQLSNDTTSISSKLGIMSEKATNINNVVTTITKVADQTNLLSLNAAIEAEKAGEYGAGFAVVAREIRRLADQTAVATLDIEQMVKEMQSAVATGVMEMDKFNKAVGDSVKNAVYIGEQMAQVIDRVQSLTPRFREVSDNMEDQAQGAQQINEAMGQLTQASQQTSEALRETNSALGQLDDAAQRLRLQMAQISGTTA